MELASGLSSEDTFYVVYIALCFEWTDTGVYHVKQAFHEFLNNIWPYQQISFIT